MTNLAQDSLDVGHEEKPDKSEDNEPSLARAELDQADKTEKEKKVEAREEKLQRTPTVGELVETSNQN